jgi:hypothetical protein
MTLMPAAGADGPCVPGPFSQAGYRGAPGAPGGPSGAEMRAALERLPPGHPSSPWAADGTRRPLPPRLHDLELPLPGVWADNLDEGPSPAPASGDRQNDPAAREPRAP